MGTLAQKKRYQMWSNVLVGGAFLLVIVGVLIQASAPKEPSLIITGGAVRFLAIIPWFIGLGEYALSKGYSSALCLLGLLSIIGLLILVLLKDKYIVSDGPFEPGASPYYRPTYGAPYRQTIPLMPKLKTP